MRFDLLEAGNRRQLFVRNLRGEFLPLLGELCRPPVIFSSSASTVFCFALISAVSLSAASHRAPAFRRTFAERFPLPRIRFGGFPVVFRRFLQPAQLRFKPDAVLLRTGQLPACGGQLRLRGGRFLLHLMESLLSRLRFLSQRRRLFPDAFDFRRRDSRPAPLTLEPPVIEPPALTTWPSSVTTRNRYPYLRAMATA